MEGWEERKNGAGGVARLASNGINVGKLDFENRHASDFCDGNPGEHDDHGHFQSELEKVGDENSPEAADEGVDSCERNEKENANEQCSVLRRAERVMKKRVAAERELED